MDYCKTRHESCILEVFMIKVATIRLFFVGFLCVMLSVPAQGMLKVLRNRTAPKFASRFAGSFARPKVFTTFSRAQHGTPRFDFHRFNSSGSGSKSQRSQFFNDSHTKWGLAGLVGLSLMTAAQTQEKETEDVKYEDFFGPRPFEKQRLAYYEYLKSKPWGKVAEKYITALEQEEKELLKKYKFLYAVPLNTKRIESQLNEQARINTAVENQAIGQQCEEASIAWKLLQKFDLACVKILSEDCFAIKNPIDLSKIKKDYGFVNGVNYSDFGGVRIVVPKNQPEMTTLDNTSRKIMSHGVVMHEIMHLLHSDTSLYSSECARFNERRADILGALAGIQYPLAIRNYLSINRIPDSWYDWFDPAHPPFSQRAQYLTKLHAEMVEAKTQYDDAERDIQHAKNLTSFCFV